MHLKAKDTIRIATNHIQNHSFKRYGLGVNQAPIDGANSHNYHSQSILQVNQAPIDEVNPHNYHAQRFL